MNEQRYSPPSTWRRDGRAEGMGGPSIHVHQQLNSHTVSDRIITCIHTSNVFLYTCKFRLRKTSTQKWTRRFKGPLFPPSSTQPTSILHLCPATFYQREPLWARGAVTARICEDAPGSRNGGGVEAKE